MTINHYATMRQPYRILCVCECVCVQCWWDGSGRIEVGRRGVSQLETDVRAASKSTRRLPIPPNTNTDTGVDTSQGIQYNNTICIQYDQLRPIYRLTGYTAGQRLPFSRSKLSDSWLEISLPLKENLVARQIAFLSWCCHLILVPESISWPWVNDITWFLFSVWPEANTKLQPFQLPLSQVRRGQLLGRFITFWASLQAHNPVLLKLTPSGFFCLCFVGWRSRSGPPSLLLSPVSWFHLATRTAATPPPLPIPTPASSISYPCCHQTWSWSPKPHWQEHDFFFFFLFRPVKC